LKLIFIHGLPGVGKLTVARELAKLTGFRTFHNHLVVDLVQSVFDFGSASFIQLREQIWTQIFSRAAADDLNGLIFTFASDRTVGKDFVHDTTKMIESCGGEVLFVGLTCSSEELNRRIEDPSRREFGKLNSVAEFRSLDEANAFVTPGIPTDGPIVDTTKLSASDAARLIVSHLGLRSLK
jgi:adenylate kinase